MTIAELGDWQALLYDSCTMCGRCTLACPMGIDIAGFVGAARHGMAEAGLVPADLFAAADRAEHEGSPLGVTPEVLRERLAWLEDEHGVRLRVDAKKADVLVTLSSIEIQKYPESLVATARILDHLGIPWTISTAGYEATNFGMLAGNVAWQRDMTLKVIEAAEACGAKTVLVPECGHAYSALRWQGAAVAGRALPFRVQHVSELIAEHVASGKLALAPARGSVTFHDPCQVSRRGGATQAPRTILAALGAELRETEDHGDLNYCCGGGGGVVANRRADALRYRAFEIKMRQIDATGAESAVTSCANCRLTFDDGAAHFGWKRRVGSLTELVADHLPAAAPGP